MPRLLRPLLAAFLLPLLLGAHPARAVFIPVEESAIYNSATGLVDFRVRFNRTPDFFTINSHGAQATFFQYEFLGDPSLPYPESLDAIVRGPEMNATAIPVREAYPTDSGGLPASGGWGSIVGWAPYELTGTVLTFSAPLDILSQHLPDGHAYYYLLTGEYGGSDDYSLGEITGLPVPEPSTLALLGLAGGLLLGGRRLGRAKG